MFFRFEVISDSCKDDGAGSNQAKPNLTITAVYRPPSARHPSTELLCQLFNNPPENSMFFGDFNFPTINWGTLQADRPRESFMNSTIDNGFKQLIDFPTHVQGNILDLTFTNKPETILYIESFGNLGNSDHSILSVDMLYKPKQKNSTELIYDYKNGDMDALKNPLNTIPWEEDLRSLDTEETWNYLKVRISTSLDLFIPKVPRRNVNKPQWMTKMVRRLIRKKQRHYNTYMDTRTEFHKDQFRQTEKLCKKAVRSAKRKFESIIAKNCNKRPFNAYIKSRTKSRDNVGQLKVSGIFITDNAGMATLVNNVFSSVFSNENLANFPDCPPLSQNHTITSVKFTPQAVCRKISKLKISSSSGPDGISSRFLADHKETMSTALSVLFTKSMESGVVPADWKTANVTPIFKKGSKSDPGNYRPISLTSIPCKIMESIMRDEVVDHLLNTQLIKSSQHGFMANRAVTTNLLEFLETVTKHFDAGDPMDIIYLDFSKAFDKVPHQRLLRKMEALGVQGKLKDWVAAWLSNRKQRTVLNGACSDWADVISGVPQGSVLGPLLFVIFINDLDNCTKHITVMKKFADDTKLGNVASSAESCRKMQECLDQLITWTDQWCMEFNVKKCKVMHVGRGNGEFQYTMNGTALQTCQQERDIGVLISNNLKPSTQCAEEARRANGILTQISRAFLYRDKKIFLQLYKQFVRCHLEFATHFLVSMASRRHKHLRASPDESSQAGQGPPGRNIRGQTQRVRTEVTRRQKNENRPDTNFQDHKGPRQCRP